MNMFSYYITTHFIHSNKDYNSYCNSYSVYQTYPKFSSIIRVVFFFFFHTINFNFLFFSKKKFISFLKFSFYIFNGNIKKCFFLSLFLLNILYTQVGYNISLISL